MSEIMPNQLPSPEFEFRKISVESADAELEVDITNKTVKIENITSGERFKGHASKLLNEIKTQFPDYEISGYAVPIDIVSRRSTMTEEEAEKEFQALFDFYRKNNFEVDEGGFFISKPPHTLRQ
jgi:hypothetical protein